MLLFFGGEEMDKVQELVKTTDLEELVFYIDYVEMILELVEKRNMRDYDLEEEHMILKNRYNELVNSN